MREDLEERLVEEYPNLYGWYGKDADEIDGPVPPLTRYGFSVGDGWYELLDSLSETLDQLDAELEAVQVKEKFGGLRFYHNGVSAEKESKTYMAIGAIRHAENMSFHVCEECGASAELRTSGWYRTLCDECWSENKSRRRTK